MLSPENISHSVDFYFVCLFIVLFDLKGKGNLKGKEELSTEVKLMHVSGSLVNS